jgi:hypothetical protein
MSCQCVNVVGCPASDGVPGIFALPSGPWQAAQGFDFARPASASAEKTGAAPAARTATASAAPVRRASVISGSS